MSNNTQVLSRGMVRKLLSDNTFFSSFSEFKMLENKLKTMNVDLSTGRGCKGCKGRRIETNLFRDFLTIMCSLSQERMQKLKKHLGVNQLMYSLQNPKTGGYETKIV